MKAWRKKRLPAEVVLVKNIRVSDVEDEKYMRMALEQAALAAEGGDVPVGAVVVCGDKVVARARNEREKRRSPVAHAEIIALEKAAKKRGTWRLSECTIYVTKEPCPMCAGAIFQARIKRLVFGATDPKGGAAGSLYNIVNDRRLNHQSEITAGVLENESAVMLREFFKIRREKRP